MDIETLGQRAAAALRDAADNEAHSEHALDEVLIGAPIIATHPAPAAPKRWPLIAAATAAAAALVVGLVIVTLRDTSDTVANTTAPSTLAPTTTPPTSSPPTTAPATTAPRPIGTLTSLSNGVSVRLPDGAEVVRTIDTLSAGYDGATVQASAISVVRWNDREVRIELSNRAPTPLGDVQPYSVDGDSAAGYTASGGLANTVVRQLLPDRFVSVSSENSADGSLAATLDELIPVAASITYDPADDERVLSRAVTENNAVECAGDQTAFAGNPGLPDLVIFGCDGVLGRYDGATGEFEELITDQGGQVAVEPSSDEPVFSNGMYDIAVTPDGSAVWYSFGDEPVAGNTALYEFGSNTPGDQQRIGFGRASSFSPDGSMVAQVNPTGVSLAPIGDPPGGGVYVDLGGGFPLGKAAVSPDNRLMAVETGPGVIALLNTATGDVQLLANDDRSVSYFAPRFRSNDSIVVAASTGSGGQGDPVSQIVLGLDGGVLEIEATPWTLPYQAVLGTDLVTLRGTSLVDRDGKEFGSGIVVAAAIPNSVGNDPVGDDSESAARPAEADSLLVHEKDNSATADNTLLEGRLIIDGCVALVNADGAEATLVWPVGTTLDNDSRTTVVLSDGRTLRSGDKVTTKGGSGVFDDFRTMIDKDSITKNSQGCADLNRTIWLGPSDPAELKVIS